MRTFLMHDASSDIFILNLRTHICTLFIRDVLALYLQVTVLYVCIKNKVINQPSETSITILTPEAFKVRPEY